MKRRRYFAKVMNVFLIFCFTFTLTGSLNLFTGAKEVHAAGVMRRVIDKAHPMLIMQLIMGNNSSEDTDFRRDNNNKWDIKQAWAALPDDIKPYIVFVLHPGHFANWLTKPMVAESRQWIQDNLAEGKDLNIPTMVLYGENPTSGSDGMTWIESLYQTYPNMIGTDISELTSTNAAIPGLLALANTYGGYHIQGSEIARCVLYFSDNMIPYGCFILDNNDFNHPICTHNRLLI
jgi:hypothetical protein